MNEKNTGKFLRQVEYIRSHLWHSYSVTVNQAMVVHRKTFEVITSTYPVGSLGSVVFLLASWYEPQALEYRIKWEIYTPYTGAAGMLLHINEKFTRNKKAITTFPFR